MSDETDPHGADDVPMQDSMQDSMQDPSDDPMHDALDDPMHDAMVDSSDDGWPDDHAADVEEAMADARSRLARVPAEVVVTNHVMGLYELAAIHLSAPTPDLVSA
ncbi:MAG: hypothetical protein ABIO83_00675, partial [Ilumatobacteraceae bacterium]